MKFKFKPISPLTFLLCGVGIALFSLLIKGTFEPFSLLAFILMASFETFSRKQKKIPSNLLSICLSALIVLGIKSYIIDFKKMASDALAPKIQKNARIFYQPTFYRLNLGDMVLYTMDDKHKVYVGEIKSINEQSLELFRIGTKERVKTKRNKICGKIIYVLQPSNNSIQRTQPRPTI